MSLVNKVSAFNLLKVHVPQDDPLSILYKTKTCSFYNLLLLE